jgi:hypothetical protein
MEIDYSFNPISSVQEVFKSMYLNYNNKIFQRNPYIEKHNLLLTFTRIILDEKNQNPNNNKDNKDKDKENSIENEEEENININKINNNNDNYNDNKKINNKTIDEIFSRYLIEVLKETNKEYFEFITKFVILFRECINKIRDADVLREIEIERNRNPGNISDINYEEFSSKNNAESVPDICNEFITDFMENNDYFGLDTNELIEIIQHLCNWIYENKYTTSKLSLVN